MHRNVLPPVLTVSALLLSGCAGAASAAPDTAAGLRAKLPAAIRKAGVLRVGSNLNYAPVDFKGADGEPAGVDPELAQALGSFLGLKVQISDMAFDSLIPAVQSRQIDLAMSAVIDTQQRQTGTDATGRQVDTGVDFVDYFLTGTAILVKAGNPQEIKTLDQLCGRTVALQRGTVQAQIALRQQSICTRTGKALRVDQFDTDGQALAEVDSGAAVADLNDYPVAAYNTDPARGGDKYQVTGALLQTSPYGITVAKSDPALLDVVSRALDLLIRNGGYDQILTKWNVHGGALSAAAVNTGF